MGHQTMEEEYLTHQTIGKKNHMIKNEKPKEVMMEVRICTPSVSLLLIVDVRKPFARGFSQF